MMSQFPLKQSRQRMTNERYRNGRGKNRRIFFLPLVRAILYVKIGDSRPKIVILSQLKYIYEEIHLLGSVQTHIRRNTSFRQRSNTYTKKRTFQASFKYIYEETHLLFSRSVVEVYKSLIYKIKWRAFWPKIQNLVNYANFLYSAVHLGYKSSQVSGLRSAYKAERAGSSPTKSKKSFESLKTAMSMCQNLDCNEYVLEVIDDCSSKCCILAQQ